jgi:predicted short-subunit dehydrogenase-like oxidoreductase (DUF2520 family)
VIRRLVITLIVIGCCGLLVVAAMNTRRGDTTTDVLQTGGSGRVVEALIPANGAATPRQVQIGIDLGSAYDAQLVVNGVVIPPDQLEKHPELNQVLFTPGPDKVIKVLEAGKNCAKALLFRVDGTPAALNNPEWCFSAL